MTKAGVEARGKALRRQALVPIPSAATLAAINQTLLARMDARLEIGRDIAGDTIGVRFPEETAHFRPVPPPVCRGGHDDQDRLAARAGAVRRRRYSVPCRWAGLDLIARIGATTCHDRRPRRPTDRPSAQTLRPAIDRLSPLPAGAGAQTASRPPSAARALAGSRARHFQRCGTICTRPIGRAKPRGSLPRCSATRHTQLRASSSAAGRRAAHRHAAPARADARSRGAAGPRVGVVPAALRDVDVASGCAADYDGWLAEAV